MKLRPTRAFWPCRSCNEALSPARRPGTHHAFYDYGAGFCIINDLAITARYLLDSGAVKRLAVVDLDVHQVRLCDQNRMSWPFQWL